MSYNLDLLPYAEILASMDSALDYSLSSLTILDKLMECLRQGLIERQVSPDQMHWMIVGAAAYFAEVLRRQMGASWVHTEGQEPWLETAVGPAFPFRLARQAIALEDSDTFMRAARGYTPATQSFKRLGP